MIWPKSTKEGLTGGNRFEARQLRIDRAQPVLFLDHVVAGQRKRMLVFGQLNLEVIQSAVAERQLRGGKIEFPHAAEALIIDFLCALAMIVEAPSPLLQRFSV